MTIPSFEPISEADFERAKSVSLQPISCLRCGRTLFSRASIVRGYGQTCALYQALEELSHGPRDRSLLDFKPKPTVSFDRLNQDAYEISDHRGYVIGGLIRTKSGPWNIVLWGHRVDLDMDLDNAKRRVVRILARMSR